MKYGIIGAGNVGLTFAYYLLKSNRKFVIFTRSVDSKNDYFDFIPREHFTENLNDLLINCDIIFIAIPDYVIEKTINSIRSISISTKIVVFSGAYSHNMHNIYNLHPAASIPQPVFTNDFLKKIVFTARESTFMDNLKEDLGLKIIYISEFSPLYHVGAMMASNFITILLLAAENLLKLFTKNEKDTMILIDSLSSTGLNAFFRNHRISGPIARGDTSIMEKHRSVLKGKKEEIIYQALTKYGVENFNAKK